MEEEKTNENTSSEENTNDIGQDKEIWGLRIPYSFLDFMQTVAFALVICIVVYIFIAMPNQIEGDSMIPNFHNGEIILTSKLSQWLGQTQVGQSLGLDYNRGDVIVFQKPGFNDFIKRIVGMPKDKIALKEGYVYINGEKLNETYLPNGLLTKGGDFIENNGEEKPIPDGRYFVMGDNRNDSHDSRYLDIGFISHDWLKGKVIVRYWPLDKITGIQTPSYK